MNQSGDTGSRPMVGFVLHEDAARIHPVDRDLSPAPLWRNAPGRATKTPATVAFQQSLRCYPVKSPSMPSFSGAAAAAATKRNFVTNLEDESRKCDQASPFYLDYLEWNRVASDGGGNISTSQPTANQSGQPFDHSRFMDMFRMKRNNTNNNGDRRQQQVVAKSGTTGGGSQTKKTLMGLTAATAPDDNSLPYSVNDDSYGCLESAAADDNNNNSAIISGGEDSMESAPAKTISGVRMRIHRPGPAARASRYSAIECRQPIAVATARDAESEKRQQNLSSSYHRPLPSQRQQPTAMENAKSSNTSNVTQRIQSAAERRAQIDDARRERIQRHVEQTRPVAPWYHTATTSVAATLREQPFFPGHSTNPSVAFGSTRPRNIDLTRPLVTPLPVRPKSEIFSSSGLPYNNNMSQSQTDSACPPRPTDLGGPVPFEPIQPAVAKNVVQSPMSFFRAARRHDPELIPAKQRYQFRDYGAPSSGWTFGSGIKKENSVMTCSMTSSKSYQTRHALVPESSGLNRATKSKSYSMNRLDQLAQPRKRAEPRVPAKSPDSGTPTTARPATSKPTPPPKNFSASAVRSHVPKETVGRRSPPAPASSTTTSRKPRPLSQIETTSESRAASTFEPPKTSDEPALSDKSEREDERLAEYKRQLAEKRALYRKRQEQQQKSMQPNKQSSPFSDKSEQKSDSNELKDSPKVVPRQPRAAEPINESKSLADETKEALEKQPSTPAVAVTKVAKEEAVAPEAPAAAVLASPAESSLSPPSSCDSTLSNTETNASTPLKTNPSDDMSVYDTPPTNMTLVTEQLDETLKQLSPDDHTPGISTCDDSVIQQTTMDKSLLQANPMNASFDSSLLHSTSPAAAQQQPNPNALTTEEIEKRKQEQLRKHEMERRARKSRIQEILKGRTRKDDASPGGDAKEAAGSNGGGSVSSTDESSIESQQPQSILMLPNGAGDEDSSSSSSMVHMNGNSQMTTTASPYVKTNGVHHETLRTSAGAADTAEANGF